ncbi:MAG TPA: HNH endonuclease signature motif containing protein [Blastocatellia bacterium]|nr:HNH endonuclease signature motif containing protein [Blastocatellia bacterium]
MSSDISNRLRQRVALRAAQRCEYCRVPQHFVQHKHEPDHIRPRQHGGVTIFENLALSCFRCNRRKGPNVASFDPLTGQLILLFNPRTQLWHEHFAWEGAVIQPLTAEGRVTVNLLRLNDEDRLAERQTLLEAGLLY